MVSTNHLMLLRLRQGIEQALPARLVRLEKRLPQGLMLRRHASITRRVGGKPPLSSVMGK